MRILKKAPPMWGAFLFLALSAPQLYAACLMPLGAQQVQVVHIYDGDTVKLKDGRRVRLIGINAPEVAKESVPAEPFADDARQYLRSLLSNAEVRMVIGEEPYDRYKRSLGYLYADGHLLSELLIKAGLGYQVAIPPNTRNLDCLKQAEAEARQNRKGVWLHSPREVVSLRPGESGFRLLRGRVLAVKKIRAGYLLEIESQLAVKIDFELAEQLGATLQLTDLLNREVEIRGWIRPRSKNAPAHYQPWFLQLTHPMQLRI